MTYKSQTNFSPNTFARRVSLDLLEEYLFINDPEVAKNQKISEENYSDNFDESYKKLPADIQEKLSLINDIASEKGMPFLLETCTKHNIQLDVNSLVPHDLALRILILDQRAFMEAFNWFSISLLENYKDYIGKKAKNPVNNKMNDFKKELIEYLKEQARGNQVHIDSYDKDDRIAYLINFGDYLKNYDVFDEGNFLTIKQRLAKAITLIYYPNTAKIRVKAPTEKLGQLVRSLFAKYLLEDQDFFGDSYKHRFFNLNTLKNLREGDLLTHPSDNIGDVTVKEVHAYLSNDETSKIIVKYPDNLSKMCEERKIDKDLLKVFKVKIQFKFLHAGRSNSKTIEMTDPNISNLNDSDRDNLIKQYLGKWKILSE